MIAITETETVYYVHNDYLPTPQVITDQNQQIVWQATYTPFGQATVQTQTLSNNVRFPGQYFDAETGLHYNYFRYYDPETGRYITSDPIGLLGGLNTYAYVGGNSLSYIDPYGLEICAANGQLRVCTDGMRPPPEGTPLNGPLSPVGIASTVAEGAALCLIPYAKKTGVRTLPFGTTAEKWSKLSPKQRFKLNDGALRKRINEGDNFKYTGADPSWNPAMRKKFDLTGSELLRLKDRGLSYETVTP